MYVLDAYFISQDNAKGGKGRNTVVLWNVFLFHLLPSSLNVLNHL